MFAEVSDLLSNDDCNAMLKKALKALRDELRVSKRKELKKKQPSAKEDAAPVRQAKSHPPHDPTSRHVPRWMEREVRQLAGHRCTFEGTGGRCTARWHLQVHHIIPVARGGPTELANLTLVCGVHNRYQAELDLGRQVANAWRERAAPAR